MKRLFSNSKYNFELSLERRWMYLTHSCFVGQFYYKSTSYKFNITLRHSIAWSSQLYWVSTWLFEYAFHLMLPRGITQKLANFFKNAIRVTELRLTGLWHETMAQDCNARWIQFHSKTRQKRTKEHIGLT